MFEESELGLQGAEQCEEGRERTGTPESFNVLLNSSHPLPPKSNPPPPKVLTNTFPSTLS